MPPEYDAGYAARQIQRQESLVRRAVRFLYLRTLRRLTEGPVCDLGCGAGAFLFHAPEGSLGLDVNAHAVAYCQARGLKASVYDAVEDGLRLTPLVGHGIRTILLNHLLEHFAEPKTMLAALLDSARRLRISRIVIVTPGRAGFRADPTHRTHIDATFYQDRAGFAEHGFGVKSLSYFPLPSEWAGHFFVYNELRAVLEALGTSAKTQVRASR